MSCTAAGIEAASRAINVSVWVTQSTPRVRREFASRMIGGAEAGTISLKALSKWGYTVLGSGYREKVTFASFEGL